MAWSYCCARTRLSASLSGSDRACNSTVIAGGVDTAGVRRSAAALIGKRRSSGARSATGAGGEGAGISCADVSAIGWGTLYSGWAGPDTLIPFHATAHRESFREPLTPTKSDSSAPTRRRVPWTAIGPVALVIAQRGEPRSPLVLAISTSSLRE